MNLGGQKYLDASNDWFHNYRENGSLLYGHYDGPVDTSMLRCPTKEELEVYLK